MVSRHKGPVTRKKFPFDAAKMGPKRCHEYAEIDVIYIPSCKKLDMFHIQSTKCVFIIADIIVFILANIYHVDA